MMEHYVDVQLTDTEYDRLVQASSRARTLPSRMAGPHGKTILEEEMPNVDAVWAEIEERCQFGKRTIEPSPKGERWVRGLAQHFKVVCANHPKCQHTFSTCRCPSSDKYIIVGKEKCYPCEPFVRRLGPRDCKDCGHTSTQHRLQAIEGKEGHVTIHECLFRGVAWVGGDPCDCPQFMSHSRRFKHPVMDGL